MNPLPDVLCNSYVASWTCPDGLQNIRKVVCVCEGVVIATKVNQSN